jgi:8-oxo-dGTP diphosphatase
VRASGDGWTQCTQGHTHWGLYGAAGLFLVADECVLLQQRAKVSHHGGTWGLPGGALDLGETASAGALREAFEETGIDRAAVVPFAEYVDSHGSWAYTTVLARSPRLVVSARSWESTAVEWTPLADVTSRELHPGLRAALPRLVHLLGDAATA